MIWRRPNKFFPIRQDSGFPGMPKPIPIADAYTLKMWGGDFTSL